MSQSEKAKERFCTNPKDFTYDELKTMLRGMGYKEVQGSGSRVKFINETDKDIICLHKPHPDNVLKHYLIEQIKRKLEEVGKL